MKKYFSFESMFSLITEGLTIEKKNKDAIKIPFQKSPKLIITTNHPCYAEMYRKIAGHGYKNLRAKEGQIKLNQSVYQDPDYKRHDTLGWNYRMNEITAALALAQMERAEFLVNRRCEVAKMYDEAFKKEDFYIVGVSNPIFKQ